VILERRIVPKLIDGAPLVSFQRINQNVRSGATLFANDPKSQRTKQLVEEVHFIGRATDTRFGMQPGGLT
jgi:hypothetical protein